MRSRTRRLAVTGAVLLAAAAGLYLARPVITHVIAQAILASRAPRPSTLPRNFTLADASGAKVSLSDFRGKVVLLNFWATWCGPCKTEIPWFIDFEKNYRDRNFSVLGVSMDEDGWAVIKPFVATNKINYPVLLGNENISQLYGGIEAIPMTILIGRNGKIAFVHAGLAPRIVYEKEIAQLMAAAS